MNAETVKLNNIYYSLSYPNATVLKDQSSDQTVYSALTEVSIPATVTYDGKTYNVTAIGSSAFYGCNKLTSVSLPASIKSINSSAFKNCTSLVTINLPEGMTSIGSNAFEGCIMTSVTIPSTMTSIGAKAYYGCPVLSSVTWNAVNCSIETGSDAPFYNRSELITSFTFGDQVQKIPAYLCQYMSNLESVVIPASVTYIGSSVFSNCSKLKSVNIPDGITYVNNSLFYGCKALPSITLPQSITIINSSAFYGCEGLTSITLHEGITSLGSSAFYNSGLTSVTIPSTMTSIGAKAFYGCGALTKVVWNAINCSIETGSDAPFYNRSDLITSFTFGDQVQKIPAYLCQYMTNLESVVIPASVNYIGASTFYGCSKLKSVDLPEGITYVASSLFYGCSSLESVSIPKTVTSINSSAFYNCTKLASVSIPESATTIGDKAFYNCSNLQSIYNYAYTPQSINEDVVKNVNKQTCVLYVSRDAYDLYASKPVWCDFVNKVKMNTGLRFEDNYISFSYLEKDGEEMYGGVELVHMPIAPKIDNFVFEKWEVLAGDLADGVRLQAIYKEDTGTGAPEVYINPANPAQKLIRRGNVYVLQDGRTYSVSGTRVE